MIILHWLVDQTVLRGDKLGAFEIPLLHTVCVFQRHCQEQTRKNKPFFKLVQSYKQQTDTCFHQSNSFV